MFGILKPREGNTKQLLEDKHHECLLSCAQSGIRGSPLISRLIANWISNFMTGSNKIMRNDEIL